MQQKEVFSIGSLNFVDLNGNNGPSVNEIEFNKWLMLKEKDVVLFTPSPVDRIDGGTVVAFGRWTLRHPVNLVINQFKLAWRIRKVLRYGALLYYRHSRFVFVVLLLKKLRPDIRVAAVRINGSMYADGGISRHSFGRWLGKFIERVDWVLRRKIARIADWIDCVTSEQAALLSESTGRQVNVVPNGVNVKIFVPMSDIDRRKTKRQMGIAEDDIVIGYCGGFPMQRGAVEIMEICAVRSDVFGVIVGKLGEKDFNYQSIPNVRFVGEVDYGSVPAMVSLFDIAVAFDDSDRARRIGNSNQKIRQALACGVYVITRYSDIDFASDPVLGRDLEDKSLSSLLAAVDGAIPVLTHRRARREYAMSRLSNETIFGDRHERILMALAARN